uniref:SMC domain protein n=1 Tax=Marinomonas sp. (strain MWYL1) TaxID=400668 RepID=A6VYG0_MARMS
MYLKSVYIKNDEYRNGFPFHLEVYRKFKELEFNNNVTFLVGENGSGKSTLLEALSINSRAIVIGSADISQDRTLDHVRNFAGMIRVSRRKVPKRTVFFRAEDAFGFTKRIIDIGNSLHDMEREIEEEYGNSEHRERAAAVMRGQRFELRQQYGESPDAKSHGESFMDILHQRLVPGGLYLLDEPETPLSPLRQLALINLISEFTKKNCQFIIATHSPILMGLPGADIYCFEDGEIKKTDYEDVEHVYVTKMFLSNPKSLLQEL